MQALSQGFARLDLKVRLALVAALLLFVLVEIWLLGLRGPWQQWQKAKTERHTRAQVVTPDLSADLALARQTLDKLQAQATALQTAHSRERLEAWRRQLQSVAEQYGVSLGALNASAVDQGLPRINLEMSGRFADLWMVQQALPGLDMPLLITQWQAKLQAGGSLTLHLEAVPSVERAASAAASPAPTHDPFGSVKPGGPSEGKPQEALPKLRALVAAGRHSMVASAMAVCRCCAKCPVWASSSRPART
ncbi:MAG: hypothetical protein C4K60_03920 [Ideonella sp. MAG2]|nr:MAG: hypothetical protein C4K60_03920 [Ideonella sp. MAG2]